MDTPARLRRPLRLAVVTETYAPEVNGVAATIACCVQGLRERGHQVQLVRPWQGAGDVVPPCDPLHGPPEVLLRGMPIPRYPHLRMGLPAARELRTLWSGARPDLVHVVTEGPLGWSAVQAARSIGLPLSSDFRTNFHAYGAHYGLGWLRRPVAAYLRHFHNRTDLTMVPTEGLRRELAAQGFERLQVVARGVDAALFHPERRSDALRAQWGADAQTPVVLHVGRIAPEKNLGLLWEAVQAMRQVDPRTLLVMVGDGPQRAQLERQWRGHGVVFAGLQSGKALAEHYASGDVFLFPSETETFGNVTPEAMASGLAVVAYDYAAAAGLLHNSDNGLLAAFGEPAHFVQSAVWLARMWRERPAQVDAMRQAARHTAVDLTWPAVVGQIEGHFAALLHASGIVDAVPRPALRAGARAADAATGGL